MLNEPGGTFFAQNRSALPGVLPFEFTFPDRLKDIVVGNPSRWA